MLAAIKRYLPAGVHVNPPQGGLFIWLRLPENLSSLDLLPLVTEEGVEYAPGPAFSRIPQRVTATCVSTLPPRRLKMLKKGFGV